MKTLGKLALLAAVSTLACAEPAPDLEDRQAAVAEAGSAIMPFDLDATTHIFEKTEDGGLQQVISDDGDPTQIRLVREHLEEEAARFAEGDFHDPAMIHGEAMPGLHELTMNSDRLMVQYSALENGAQITYSSEDESLVQAIHAWFDAQLTDHGAHAQDHR